VAGEETATPAAVQPFTLIIDGKVQAMEAPPIPLKIEEEDAAFLPMSLLRDLGAQVKWDAATKTVTVLMDNVTATAVVGQARVRIGEEEVTLAQPMKNFGGRTMVLDQFLERALGVTVTVNSEAREIRITTPTHWGRLLHLESAAAFRGPQVAGRIDVYCPSRKPDQEIVVNYAADTDCYLQVYDVLGDTIKPLFGLDQEGKVTLADFLPACPIPLVEFRGSGRRFGRWPLTLDSVEEEHFIMIASLEKPEQDYLKLIQAGQAPPSGWLITGYTLPAAKAAGGKDEG
jgi:hypothetical protein